MNDKKNYMSCKGHECLSCCVGLRDFTKIYYKHNNHNKMMVMKYDKFLQQEQTIKQVNISLNDLMSSTSRGLLEFLEFEIKNTKCIYHKSCVHYYLHNHKGEVIDQYHKHFNSIKIYI